MYVVDKAPQEAVLRLIRARKVLAGLDEEGHQSTPHQFSKDVISFADGEGMRRPHPNVVAAGVAALLESKVTSLEKYFFLKRLEELDNQIAQIFIKGGIDKEIANNICISTGTSHLFNAFFYSVAEPGDIFLTAPGYYHSLANWCHINNVELQCIPTKQQNDFKLTLEDLESWYSHQGFKAKKPKGIILFNPTYIGAVYQKEELSKLVDFIVQNDLVVLEDAIFMDTIFGDNETMCHLGSFRGIQDRVITVHGGSKAYGLANMRIGWACGPKHIIDKMNFYTSATQVDAPHVSKVMALVALQASNEYLSVNNYELKERAKLIVELTEKANKEIVNNLGFLQSYKPIIEVLFKPKSGHSIVLSLNELKGMKTDRGFIIRDSIDITRFFLSEAHVCLSPGLSMGFPDCTVRISYGCVGVDYTHEGSETIELLRILNETIRRLDSKINFNQVLESLGLSEREIERQYEYGYDSGFKIGRKLIEEGIMNRMVPSIINLFSKNSIHYIL
jgi:aspartate aminotransferase